VAGGPAPRVSGHTPDQLRITALEMRVLGLTMQVRDLEMLFLKLGIKHE
jgi:hypothetical protein